MLIQICLIWTTLQSIFLSVTKHHYSHTLCNSFKKNKEEEEEEEEEEVEKKRWRVGWGLSGSRSEIKSEEVVVHTACHNEHTLTPTVSKESASSLGPVTGIVLQLFVHVARTPGPHPKTTQIIKADRNSREY